MESENGGTNAPPEGDDEAGIVATDDMELLEDEEEGDEDEEEEDHEDYEVYNELLAEIDNGLDFEDEEEEEEEDETEYKKPLKFYGNADETDVDDRQARLLLALKKRDFIKEQMENPLPQMTTKTFDLSLPEERRLKLLAQFPSTQTMRRFERPYTPVDLEICTDYEPNLPQIGLVRKVKRERPRKEDIHKIVKIIMPPEEEVVNPFFFPDDIPAFMAAQEEERVKKREANLNVPCKEKLHGTALIQKEIARRVRPYQAADSNAITYDPLYDTIMWEAGRGLNITRIQKVSRKLHANYAKHRKDVFYSEYGIYSRHKAVEKLREQEEAEEVALKNYEYLSNYAAESLDVFLRESEDSKNQASKVSEEKLKENIVLAEQSRNLNLETSSMKAEISSLNENLRECKYYMQFLDNVAHELMRRDEEEKYRTERRQQQIKEDLATFLREGMTLKQAQKALKEKNKEFIGSQFRKTTRSGTESAEFLQKLQEEAQAQTLRVPMASRVNSIINMLAAAADKDDGFDEQALLEEMNLVGGDERTDKEELAGLVFTRPSQLLDIYVDVEEQNLSLIQHAQINEEVLEALERRIKENRKGTEGKSRRLRDIINDIEIQMQKTNEQIETLNLLINMFTGGYYDVKSQEKLMKLLRKHVNKLYKTCIGTNSAHLSSVLMLTSIEKNFEDVVRDLESIPTDVVLKISRGLEKERRESERREQEAIRNKHRNERVAKSLDRAKAPAKHTKGRKLAFRSRPPKVSATLVQKQLESKAEEDDWNYYFGE